MVAMLDDVEKENILENRDYVASLIGWVATVVAILMWSSLVDQIRLNLAGQKGSVIFATAVVLNCTLWVTYSVLKKPRLWPRVIQSMAGSIRPPFVLP